MNLETLGRACPCCMGPSEVGSPAPFFDFEIASFVDVMLHSIVSAFER